VSDKRACYDPTISSRLSMDGSFPRMIAPQLCRRNIGPTMLLAVCCFGQSQQLPPAVPPKPLPSSQNEAPTVRVTTNEVLVPTLVEKSGGGVLYGLKQSDFVLEDNGVQQKIRVQEEMDTAPVVLVVAVEEGGVSALEFDKVAKLAPLLDLFVSDPRSQVALMGFDSRPHLIHDYTHSSDDLDDALQHLEPGDGGAAILDTVSSAVDLLELQPKEFRRVLLLVSEERDHGSKHTKPVQLIQKIGRSDVLVLSVSFSPSRAELLHDLKDSGDDRTLSMVSALVTAVKAFKKNVAKEVAQESGGEYMTFTRDKAFEQRVVDAAKHVRNRYLITFSPSSPAPGLHTIHVRTTQDYGARIVARANYWLQSEP
jgi:VWFA-related protein